MLSCFIPLSVALVRLTLGSVPAPALPEETPVHLGLALRVSSEADLSALLARQQDPNSPDYHRWLTPAEFGERFGQPAALYERAARWLESSGFTVTRFPNRTFVEAVGQSGQVTRALGVHLKSVDGSPLSVHVPDQRPTFPAFLGQAVVHVAGLDTHLQFKHRLMGSGGQPSFGPQDLRRFYDSQPLLDEGFIGQGQQLVVLSTAPPPGTGPNAAAIEYFLRNISNSSATFIQDVLSNPEDDFDLQGGLGTEFALDVEMQSVGSPGAKSITLVVAPSSQVFSVGVNHIVNELSTATAVSVSLGGCEPNVEKFQDGLVASFQQLLRQGLAEGQTWSAATGDNGSDDCQDGKTLAVDFPSSIPEMVAAGGAAVPSPSWNSAGALTAYQTEIAWNDGAVGGGAGGGGFSVLYAAPGYQQSFSFSGRSVPDIALIAGGPGVLYDNPLPGELFPVEGTSVASPLSAGFFALIASRVGCRLGDVHQTLYTLGNAQLDGGAQVFHDIVRGGTALNGVDAGLLAKVGYDQVTGWGSLDVQALANAWPPCRGDAGVPGSAYDPCAILSCGGDAVCDTLPDGPSSCGCDPNLASSCPQGMACSQDTLFSMDGGVCTPGCRSDADCADAGQVCSTCETLCVAPGRSGSAIGDACNDSTDCPNGAVCSGGRGFMGNYCTQACVEGDSQAAACGCPSGSVCGVVGFFRKVNECLVSCSADSQCRQGYLCQPIAGGSSACLPSCQVNGTRDTCSEYGSNSVCDVATGACQVVDGGPAGDGGGAEMDGGIDAGDGGQSVPDSGIADSGVTEAPDSGAPRGDGGQGTITSGCSSSLSSKNGSVLWGLLALGALLRRRRNAAPPET